MEVLLTSEKYIKETTNISANIAGHYMLPAMVEAQEMGLRTILGDNLIDKLKDVVSKGLMQGSFNDSYNESFDRGALNKYKALLDKCQVYLAYQTIVELIYKIAFKLNNAGVITTPDENVNVEYLSGVATQREYYQAKSDFYKKRLQNFLLQNYQDYPELTENDCRAIKANLRSAASCGIFLGGARGKGRVRRCH